MMVTTERLVLRPWREEDAESLYRYACDGQVGPAAGWKPHESVEESRRIIRTVLSQPDTLAVLLRERPEETIGSVGVFPTDAPDAAHPASFKICTASSVVPVSSSFFASARSAPARTACAVRSSARQSASWEWVFIIPPDTLTNFPRCATKRMASKPSSATNSSVFPT